jgi:hypothetical protein
MSDLYREFYTYFVRLLKKHLFEAEEAGDLDLQVKLMKVYMELQRLLKT